MNSDPNALLPGIAVAIGVIAMGAATRRARRNDASARVVVLLTNGRAAVAPTARLVHAWRVAPAWLTVQLRDAEVPIRVEDAWRSWRVAGLVAFVVGLAIGGPVLAVIALAVAAGIPVGAAAVVQSRQAAAYDATLAAALDGVARGVRSGGSLAASIGEAASAVRGAVAFDVQRVATAVERGQPLATALGEWATRRDRASVRLAVGALVLAAETGGPPARVIEEVAGALRIQLQVEGEARALASQARLSALVVGVAPVGFVALSSVTDARNAHMLFGTPIGVGCLVVGLALDAIGAVWMHRISESVIR